MMPPKYAFYLIVTDPVKATRTQKGGELSVLRPDKAFENTRNE
jgi:hypothetical protein